MMKTPGLVFGIALMTSASLMTAQTYASEVRSGGRANGDRDATAPLVQHSTDKPKDQHVAEGGADRLTERQFASDGSDHLKQNRVAGSGYTKDDASDVTPYFCADCR